jgi:hypothetical protein
LCWPHASTNALQVRPGAWDCDRSQTWPELLGQIAQAELLAQVPQHQRLE